MITLTLGRDKRVHMNPASDAARPAGDDMRDLLHDTALLVTTLASGGTVRNAALFRERCKQLVEQFEDALIQRHYPDDVKREALVAQCGLLDEMALRHLSADARLAWEAHPMQVERFFIHDAGSRIIDCIEAHLHESSPDVDLLEFYTAIMGMGFIGRYAREGKAKRAALIAALTTRLESLRPSGDEPFFSEPAGSRLSSGLYRLAPWIIFALVCVAAVTVWIAASVLLDMQLVHIGPARIVGP